MTKPPAPLPKRRPLRTREEVRQAGRERDDGMKPEPEPAERLATLLMLAFPAGRHGAESAPRGPRETGGLPARFPQSAGYYAGRHRALSRHGRHGCG